MAQFTKRPPAGPLHLSTAPQKEAPVDKYLVPGLEHRPFSDDEIKQAFDTFDLDKNRFVGAAEIQHILEIIGEEVTDEEIDEMIRICDTDGDGQVTFDEFYKMMTEAEAPQAPEAPKLKTALGPKKYAKSRTQPLIADVAAASATQGQSRRQQKEAALEAKESNNQFRADSVEFLVRKLSGGMNKIKPSQIKKVYKRFQEIDVDGSGAIDYKEFCQALDVEDNPISEKMFNVFDMDGSGNIELREFMVMLTTYTAAAKTEKLRFAFMMFDEDQSGFIERDELVNMLGASFVVEGYSPAELEERADMVFDFLNLPRDGGISYQDFLQLSKTQNGLIYPVEEKRHAMRGDFSINRMLQEADTGR